MRINRFAALMCLLGLIYLLCACSAEGVSDSAKPAQTPRLATLAPMSTDAPLPQLVFEPSVAQEPSTVSAAPSLLVAGPLFMPGSDAESELLFSLLGEGYSSTSGDPPSYRSADGLSRVIAERDGQYVYFNDSADGPSVKDFAHRILSTPGISGLAHANPAEISPYSFALTRTVNGIPVHCLYRMEGVLIYFDGRVAGADIIYSDLEPETDIEIIPFEDALALVNAALLESMDEEEPKTYAVKDAQLVYDCPRLNGAYDETRLVPHWRIRYPALGAFDIGMSEGVEMEIEYMAMVNCQTGEVDFR